MLAVVMSVRLEGFSQVSVYFFRQAILAVVMSVRLEGFSQVIVYFFRQAMLAIVISLRLEGFSQVSVYFFRQAMLSVCGSSLKYSILFIMFRAMLCEICLLWHTWWLIWMRV